MAGGRRADKGGNVVDLPKRRGRGGTKGGGIAILAVLAVAGLASLFGKDEEGQAGSRAVLPAAATATETVVGAASVIDGDTVEVHGQRVRLHGVDAPESAQTCLDENGSRYRCGQRAANALAEKIGRSTVTCAGRDRDRYGRLVAVCTLPDGGDVGAWLVRRGHALAYREYSTDYVAAEAEAQQDRAGLWRGSFVEPWDWRRGERLDGAAPAEASAPGPAVYVTGDAVNVRAGPSTEDPVVGQGRRGDRAEELARRDGWVRLRLHRDGAEGWMFGRYVGSEAPATAARAEPTAPGRPQVADDDIRRAIIDASIAGYSGNCPCPYNVDRAGRRCGGRSAYSRPGGASPYCYPDDVPVSAVAAYRQRSAGR